jgi:hypothetical protein
LVVADWRHCCRNRLAGSRSAVAACRCSYRNMPVACLFRSNSYRSMQAGFRSNRYPNTLADFRCRSSHCRSMQAGFRSSSPAGCQRCGRW